MTTFRPMTPRTKYRMPEHGRIRLGVQVPTRNGKMRPEKLTTLRFTSVDRDAIDALAGLYGGTVKPWKNGNRDEWEVITDTPEVEVVLPEDPLGDTPFYELYSRGGLERRCDGEIARCPTRVGKDDVDIVEHPCICNARQQAECKVVTRLAVILPKIPFGGTWTVTTHSWNAADELPGMVAAVQQFSRSRFNRAFLGIREEEKMEAGQKKSYIVPYLRNALSVEQVLEGAGQLDAIEAPTAGEIGPAPQATPPAEAPAEPVTPGPHPPAAREDGILYIPVLEGKHQLLSAVLTVGKSEGEAKRIARQGWSEAGLPDEPDDMVDEETVAGLIARLVPVLVAGGEPF